MSSIFVTGDTHGNIDLNKLNNCNFSESNNLNKTDYVIITGDFGLVWEKSKSEKYWLDWLKQKKFSTLFVDGNHENFDLLNQYPIEQWCGGKVHRIEEGILHLMRGQVFNINGLKFFTFGGAPSHDRQFRIEKLTWWAEEIPSDTEFAEGLSNLAQNNWAVDYIITHTCSTQACISAGLRLETSTVNRYFDLLESKTKYRHWYCGHFHQDKNLSTCMTIMYNQIVKIDDIVNK